MMSSLKTDSCEAKELNRYILLCQSRTSRKLIDQPQRRLSQPLEILQSSLIPDLPSDASSGRSKIWNGGEFVVKEQPEHQRHLDTGVLTQQHIEPDGWLPVWLRSFLWYSPFSPPSAQTPPTQCPVLCQSNRDAV